MVYPNALDITEGDYRLLFENPETGERNDIQDKIFSAVLDACEAGNISWRRREDSTLSGRIEYVGKIVLLNYRRKPTEIKVLMWIYDGTLHESRCFKGHIGLWKGITGRLGPALNDWNPRTRVVVEKFFGTKFPR